MIEVFAADEQSAHPVDTLRWVRLARAVLGAEGVKGDAELSMLFVDEPTMADLNRRFRGEEGPTDVLSFPIDGPSPASGPPDGPVGPRGFAGDRLGGDEDDDLDLDDEEDDDAPWLLGDVVLCPAYAAEHARQAGQSLEAELELLTVHGILHLCGLDHAEPEDEQAMRARTDELLDRWRERERP